MSRPFFLSGDSLANLDAWFHFACVVERAFESFDRSDSVSIRSGVPTSLFSAEVNEWCKEMGAVTWPSFCRCRCSRRHFTAFSVKVEAEAVGKSETHTHLGYTNNSI